jgi:hypothetical protein
LKRLTIQMKAYTPQGDTFDARVSFRRIPSASDRPVAGRDFTTATVRVLNEAGTYGVVASGQARLGQDDAMMGRYNFWAGARIAFDRALDQMRQRYSNALVRQFRHAVQIQMALSENDEAGQQAHEKLMRLSAQRDSLLAEKYALLEPLPNVEIDEAATEAAELALQFRRRNNPLPRVVTPVPEPDFKASTPRDTTLPAGRACGSLFGHPVVFKEPDVVVDAELADPYGKSIALLEALLGPDDTFSQTGDPASVDAVRLGLQILKARRLQISQGVKQ